MTIGFYDLLACKQTILSLATSHIAYLCNQFNSLIMFAPPISMPRFKSIIFDQNSPKIKLFLQKNASFRSLGAPPPNPLISSQLRIFSNAPGC